MAESRNVLHAGAPLERTLSPQRGLPWRTTVFPRHGCAAPRRNCAKVSLSCTKAQPGPGRPAWEVLTGRLGRDSWNSGCTKRESRGPGGVITRSPQVEWGGGQGREPQGATATGADFTKGEWGSTCAWKVWMGQREGDGQGQPGATAWPYCADGLQRLIPSRRLDPHVPRADLHSGQQGRAPRRRTEKSGERKRKMRREGKEGRS